MEKKPRMAPHELAAEVVSAMQEKKGEQIVVMDMRSVSGVADYFILCTGQSDLHIRAIVEHVRKVLKEEHDELPLHVEGTEYWQWVLMDYVDVVAHILSPEKRTFYNLERLWGDAPMEEVGPEQVQVGLLQMAETHEAPS